MRNTFYANSAFVSCREVICAILTMRIGTSIDHNSNWRNISLPPINRNYWIVQFSKFILWKIYLIKINLENWRWSQLLSRNISWKALFQWICNCCVLIWTGNIELSCSVWSLKKLNTLCLLDNIRVNLQILLHSHSITHALKSDSRWRVPSMII